MCRTIAYIVFVGAGIFVGLQACCGLTSDAQATREGPVGRLREEVGDQGWIVYSGRSADGDWDLFLCRPDGADLRNITRTPDYHEAAAQFSRDGRRLLYRRLPREATIDGNDYGTQGTLVLADSDGTGAKVVGGKGEYPWASWSPDGKQIACLSIRGVAFVDLATGKVLRTLPRKGFFQQTTWSPDGKRVCGVANSYSTGWSVAVMEVATGEAAAVSRVDCCTPDWFPDGRRLVFSNRPAGQKGNGGQGWTQLWMADVEGRSRRLVYGEDGRHIYGGHVSPDGKYVLFTGNMREDGDPQRAGSPMGLMRLADAPIIGGVSRELRQLHREVSSGPVLRLPVGWEPCWTLAEFPARPSTGAPEPQTGNGGAPRPTETESAGAGDGVASLATELRDKGWIAFSAPTGRGDWDLFVMRPDGSDRHRITDTRRHHEAGVRFSPDGKKILYYRMPNSETVDNNTYGTFELVVANADGTRPVSHGDGFCWASWGPAGKRIAYLDKRGIRIVDLASHKVTRQLPRQGIVQQLVWSGDGKRFTGTANGLGPFWNIGCLSAATGRVRAVSETDRYNCTPDWMPDSQQILYARGIVPEEGGWAELWVGGSDGRNRRMLYAEEGRHIYGACASPDGAYLLFTRSAADMGGRDSTGAHMAIIRRADAPMVGGQSPGLQKQYPRARRGPRLDLGEGWEPHWTYAKTAPANAIQPSTDSEEHDGSRR